MFIALKIKISQDERFTNVSMSVISNLRVVQLLLQAVATD